MLAQMLTLALAAAAPGASPAPAAQEPAQPSRTVSPIVVSPAVKAPAPDVKIDMGGSDDDIEQQVLIWPATAYHTGRDGRVTLRCKFDTHGLAERCDVVSEIPEGQGFGRAALELRPTFKLPPTQGPDGPIEAIKTISIRFKSPDTDINLGKALAGNVDPSTVRGNPLKMRAVTMLDYPVWAQAATFDDLAAAYPAKGGGVEGYAVAHCHVLHTGVLTTCQVIKETPDKHDFGKAALALAASKFRVAPDLAAIRHPSPVWVDVPIRLQPPAQLADRTVTAPAWITGVDMQAAPKVFPPEAAASGLTTGRGVARCLVATDGSLTSCTPEAGDPAGLGFSEAAAKLAVGMKMNLWSADGAPVEGGVVHVPIRLNLKGGAD